MKMEQSVPKRRHIKFRRRGITQKKAYNTYHYLTHITLYDCKAHTLMQTTQHNATSILTQTTAFEITVGYFLDDIPL